MKSASILFAAALAVMAFTGAAKAEPIPPQVEAMIHGASDAADPAVLAATAATARHVYPASAAEIDALVAHLQALAAARVRVKLLRQSFFHGWKGQGQVGASASTGNTRSTGASLGLAFTREGVRWKHLYNATVDYERDQGIETKSRYFTSWESDLHFNGPLYAVGITSWEDDRFSGFTSRASESLGLGLSLFKTDKASLDLQGGPAMRQTNYTAGDSQDEFAGRFAVDYEWTILPNLKLSEQASYYGANFDSTATSNTALTVHLIASLSAQASFFAQYETHPPPLVEKTNTTTRLTLVYSF